MTESFESGSGSWGGPEHLAILLGALFKRKWTGVIRVGTKEENDRKIFLNEGRIVFASSSVIDDRLGEIIYRMGFITLDQLTESAVKVDRVNKFGQVLLKHEVFDYDQLWATLKVQVLHILSACLSLENAVYSLHPGDSSFTEVSFTEAPESLLTDVYQVGLECVFLFSSIDDSTTVTVRSQNAQRMLKPGTFHMDVVEMMTQEPLLTRFFSKSKLSPLNARLELHGLWKKGLYRINQDLTDEPAHRSPGVKKFLMLFDGYQFLLSKARELFDDEVNFRRFLERLASSQIFSRRESVVLDDQGEVDGVWRHTALAVMNREPSLTWRYEAMMSELMRYFTQMAIDFLPATAARVVRDEARVLIS